MKRCHWKILFSEIFLSFVPFRKNVFSQKKVLLAYSNVLYIPDQCIWTFHISYQLSIYAMFCPDPLDPPSPLDPDPEPGLPHQHYIGASESDRK